MLYAIRCSYFGNDNAYITQTNRFVLSCLRKQASRKALTQRIPAPSTLLGTGFAGMTNCDILLSRQHLQRCFLKTGQFELYYQSARPAISRTVAMCRSQPKDMMWMPWHKFFSSLIRRAEISRLFSTLFSFGTPANSSMISSGT
jgi:hypothetical protein